MTKRTKKFRVDYSDGRFYLHDGETSTWGGLLELTDKELDRLERHFDEDLYWQDRFRQVDNEFHESLEGKTYCENCKQYVKLEEDPRGWPYCPICKGV
jgi:hypothetical protein